MSPSLSSDFFLHQFECLEGLSASDLADPIPGWGSDDFSIAQPFGQDGLSIVESDSDTDSDDHIVAIDADLPFFWECLHVEDDGNEFDWEDVSAHTVIPFAEDNNNNNVENTNLDTGGLNVDWEVLLSVNESVLVEDQEGFEDLFGQFGDSEWRKGGRSAARSVVESLPSVQLTEDDLAKENIQCAVCKEEIFLSDEVKGLPCLHYYHKCCIVAWLVVRNTCPLCRYELPSSNSNDATTMEGEGAAQARYEFEILQAI